MQAPFEKLRVWRSSVDLARNVYRATNGFPHTEKFGISAQLRRAATAIPTNIAEGNARASRREYVQFCQIARGSLAEVKSLLIGTCDHLGRLLERLIESLQL